MTHALHSSEKQTWQTPEDPILVRVRKVGPIVCDPATSIANPTGAQVFYAPRPSGMGSGLPPSFGWAGPCGLCGHWPVSGLTWINPPYGAHLDGDEPDPDAEIWRTVKDPVTGVKRKELAGIGTGWAARIAMHEGERISLTPNRTEVGWFERLHAASHVRAEFYRRIPFVDAATGLVGPSPNHGSVLFYHHGARGYDGVRAFVEAFADIARILPGGKRVG